MGDTAHLTPAAPFTPHAARHPRPPPRADPSGRAPRHAVYSRPPAAHTQSVLVGRVADAPAVRSEPGSRDRRCDGVVRNAAHPYGAPRHGGVPVRFVGPMAKGPRTTDR